MNGIVQTCFGMSDSMRSITKFKVSLKLLLATIFLSVMFDGDL